MNNKIMVVNPIGLKSKRRKPRTAKQKAATRKLVALNKSRRKKNPTTRRKPMKAKRSPAQRRATRALVARNRARAGRRAPTKARRKPARRRNPSPAKKRAYRRTTMARTSPARRRPARRRNPIGRGLVNEVIMPSMIGASGALVNDLIWGYLPLPDMLKTGVGRLAGKGLSAVALTLLLDQTKMVTHKTACQIGTGALTVLTHEAVRSLIQQNMPTLKLDGMGLYVSDAMGYYNPALPAGGDNLGVYVRGGQTAGRAMPSPPVPALGDFSENEFSENGYNYAS